MLVPPCLYNRCKARNRGVTFGQALNLSLALTSLRLRGRPLLVPDRYGVLVE